MIVVRRLGAETDLNRDARGAELRVTRSGNLGIRIFNRRNDAGNAGGNDGIGTGRRFTVMRETFTATCVFSLRIPKTVPVSHLKVMTLYCSND